MHMELRGELIMSEANNLTQARNSREKALENKGTDVT